MKRFNNVIVFIFGILLLIGAAGCDDGGDSGSGKKADTTPPSKISLAGITATTSSVTFTWTDPSDDDFDHVEIACSDGSSGDVESGSGTFTQSSLSASTLYCFTVKSADATGNLSAGHTFYVRTPATDTITFIAISDVAGLQAVAGSLGGNYLLTVDLDLLSSSWTPIGNHTTLFTGVFNGNGHSIRNLYISGSSSFRGLFGVAGAGAVICGLGLENIDVTGNLSVGGLVGDNYLDSGGTVTISECYVTGDVNAGSGCVGGLVGRNYLSDDGTVTISGCYATADVNAGTSYAGGLVGENSLNGGGTVTISGCYATGQVNAGTSFSGGLVGDNFPNGGGTVTISGCYATGQVNAGDSYAGGLVGCNIAAGGTVNTSNCFYDSETTGVSNNGIGAPKTTAQMTTRTTFTNAGWDFVNETVNGTDDIWSIDTAGTINGGYPYLTDLASSY